MTCRVHYSLKIGSWTAQISLIMDPIFYYNSLQIWTKTHAVPLHDTQPMQHLSSWQHLEYIECMFIWGDIEGSYKILGQCRIHYGMKKATNIQHFAGSNFFLWFTWTVYTVCLSLRLIGYLYCATSFKSSGLISLGANKIFYWVLGESTIPQFQINFFQRLKIWQIHFEWDSWDFCGDSHIGAFSYGCSDLFNSDSILKGQISELSSTFHHQRPHIGYPNTIHHAVYEGYIVPYDDKYEWTVAFWCHSCKHLPYQSQQSNRRYNLILPSNCTDLTVSSTMVTFLWPKPFLRKKLSRYFCR